MKQELPIKITSPRRLHTVYAAIAYIGCIAGYMKFSKDDFSGNEDFMVMAVLVFVAVYFSYKAFLPKTKIIFSERGIWTATHGEKKWDEFAGAAIEKKQTGRIQKENLLLLFDIEEEPQELSYDFYDLSINPKKFKKLVDGPLKPYMEL